MRHFVSDDVGYLVFPVSLLPFSGCGVPKFPSQYFLVHLAPTPLITAGMAKKMIFKSVFTLASFM